MIELKPSEILEEIDQPEAAALRTAIKALNAGERGKAALAVHHLSRLLEPKTEIPVIQAEELLETEPPRVEPILSGLFDLADKVALIGSSKNRKSWFLLQLALSLATGQNFLRWTVDRAYRVLIVQLEIKAAHFQRRMMKVSKQLCVDSRDLKGNLLIVNGRGLHITGAEGIGVIERLVRENEIEVCIVDPLYKIVTGDENAAHEMKPILAAFDRLAENTGAATIYAHHDPKGSPGDRDIRDRGAGSSVLGRDYDACITLTTHANSVDTVVETIQRNYPPTTPFSVRWEDRFVEAADLAPTPKNSLNTRRAPSDGLPPVEELVDTATREIENAVIAKKVPLTSAELDARLTRLAGTRERMRTLKDLIVRSADDELSDAPLVAKQIGGARGKTWIATPDQLTDFLQKTAKNPS